MGKTKTAFVGDLQKEAKSGEDKYKDKQKKKAEVQKAEAEKVRIPGLAGGQRVVAISAEPLPETDQETTESRGSDKKAKAGPKVRSKKYQEAKAKIDKNKNYKLADAVSILQETSYSKFDGSIELHLLVKKEGLSANVALPHSTGKQKKIEVADEKTIEKLKTGKVDFDVLLATAEMMPKLVPFAKLLGPKGLMPNPKAGTLIKNSKDKDKFSGNSLSVKTEKKQPIIHTVIGKVSQDKKEIEENVSAVLDAISRKQIIKAYIKSTMSPSIKLVY